MRLLDGITVVSLEQAVAAPFAARQHGGARVIKIERPGTSDFAWKHQSIGNHLSELAARQLSRYAAERAGAGERNDLEASLAKLFASEVAMEIALNAHVVVQGRHLTATGEKTNEIQRTFLARQVVERRRLGAWT